MKKEEVLMFKKIVGLCILILASFALAACTVQKEANHPLQGLQIVTSFHTIYSLVKEISGHNTDLQMIASQSGI